MSPQIPDRPRRRRIRHVAIVCFSVSGIAFVACGLGLLVHHALTGSLVISGTAAVGLIYLAMGVMNLGFEAEPEEIGLEEPTLPRKDDLAVPPREPQFLRAAEHAPSSARDSVLASRE